MRPGQVRWDAMKKFLFLAALLGLTVVAVRKLRVG
jgi:hypothetical protein